MGLPNDQRAALREALAGKGLRATRQREVVFAVLMEDRDHPTAEVVLERARAKMPGISMGTVYNCLETLRDCGLITQVNLERMASRYCLDENGSHSHAHFFCKRTGKVHDIDLTPEARESLQSLLPEGFEVDEIELSFRGRAESRLVDSAGAPANAADGGLPRFASAG